VFRLAYANDNNVFARGRLNLRKGVWATITVRCDAALNFAAFPDRPHNVGAQCRMAAERNGHRDLSTEFQFGVT